MAPAARCCLRRDGRRQPPGRHRERGFPGETSASGRASNPNSARHGAWPCINSRISLPAFYPVAGSNSLGHQRLPPPPRPGHACRHRPHTRPHTLRACIQALIPLGRDHLTASPRLSAKPATSPANRGGFASAATSGRPTMQMWLECRAWPTQNPAAPCSPLPSSSVGCGGC